MSSFSAHHPNAVRVREAYTRWFEGVVSPMMKLLSEDVVYHLPGKHMGGGDVHGHAGLLGLGRERPIAYDEQPHSEILDVVANERFAISYEHHVAKRKGQTMDQVICSVWRIGQDGRVAELWAHFEDQDAVDAFAAL